MSVAPLTSVLPYLMADISLLHLTAEDTRLLRAGARRGGPQDWPVVATLGGDDGFIVYVHDHSSEGEGNFPGASVAFHQLCLLAREQGCSYVRFDGEADELPDVALAQDEIVLNGEYARVGWSVEDVRSLRPAMTNAAAAAFLTKHQHQIAERLVELGWDVIETFLRAERL